MAVVDDGVASHEDLLASRILPGYDYAQMDSVPIPGDTMAHGMACAGIIGANHTTDSASGLGDSTGVISLNPRVRIVPIRVFGDNGQNPSIEELSLAITEAWSVYNADILSNSWGSNIPDWEWDILNEAINSAYVNGRSGKGSPLIFSGGNGGYYWCINDIVAYPARLDACFAVAALKLNDSAWDYNTCGPEMDISAPSSDINLQGDMWSLDQMGAVGYNSTRPGVTWDCPTVASNDNDYDCHFGGTSGACPIVSGVASLILAKDTSLTAPQVYDILRFSAVDELDWGTLSGDDSLKYGHGRVDAFRAILSLAHADADNSDAIDIGDMTFLVDWQWHSGPAPFPSELLGDVNCSGDFDVSDLTYLTDWMFNNGPAPPRPCYAY